MERRVGREGGRKQREEREEERGRRGRLEGIRGIDLFPSESSISGEKGAQQSLIIRERCSNVPCFYSFWYNFFLVLFFFLFVVVCNCSVLFFLFFFFFFFFQYIPTPITRPIALGEV